MVLDSKNLSNAYKSGANNVHNHYLTIDKLNVFPVPDGDTGTNLNLTISNAIKELEEWKGDSLAELCKVFNHNLVMGARGNSGVIFSQIFTGFHEAIIETNPAKLDAKLLIKCFMNAKVSAYKAVMSPVEGTILTVIRILAETMQKDSKRVQKLTLEGFFEEVIKIADQVVQETPKMLAVLREVGVVDSGAYGLARFFEGVAYYFSNHKIIAIKKEQTIETDIVADLNLSKLKDKFGYCTEVILNIDPDMASKAGFSLEKVKTFLFSNKGKSIILAHDVNILKVHVHLMQPGYVLVFLQQFGEFQQVKVENMDLQVAHHQHALQRGNTFAKKISLMAIVPSLELKDYFTDELKVDYVIVAGRLMNPSMKTIIHKLNQSDSEHIVLLPNNRNIFLLVEQAAKSVKDIGVKIIPTSSIAEGTVAAINYSPELPIKQNMNVMKQAIRAGRFYSINKADRDVTINNVNIKKNDFFAIQKGKVIKKQANMQALLKTIFDQFMQRNAEIVTIFVEQKADPLSISFAKKYLDENYDVEYEIVPCGSMTHDLVIAIE